LLSIVPEASLCLKQMEKRIQCTDNEVVETA
jgi:hypothetical protein